MSLREALFRQQMEEPRTVVLDTNVLVAGVFNSRRSSACILAAVRRGRLRHAWSDETRSECRRVFSRIPPLSWERVEDLFRDEWRRDGTFDVGCYSIISDVADRVFAALAATTNAVLITSDDHLLGVRARLARLMVLSPREFMDARIPAEGQE
jgi:predicted nucleic acid-binding protein